MHRKLLRLLVVPVTALMLSGCVLSTGGVPQNTLVPKGTIKYIPCVNLPGPFLYMDGVDWDEGTLDFADNYNAVWEAICE
tara:strand:- start:30 stop:269 length:240 start_codon:yes stop_codon:yes gene_type:complete